MDDGRFVGKVAMVTGAAGGMGRAIAAAFADAGASVVVSDVSAEAGEETVAGIRESGGEATFIAADVAAARRLNNWCAGR